MKYLFRNDYSFGAHPKVLTALAETSMAVSYTHLTLPTTSRV